MPRLARCASCVRLFSCERDLLSDQLARSFEFGLTPNWSAKAEYMYFDLGTDRYNAIASGTPINIPIDAGVTGSVVRVGLNYRFSSLLP
jgi:hypothetical protein